MNINKRWFVVILVLSLFIVSALLSSIAQQYAEVTVESIEITVGGTGTTTVSVRGVPEPGLADIQGSLSFDPAVIHVDEVVGLNDYEVFAADIDNDAGEVRFVVSKISGKHIKVGGFLQFKLRAVGKIGDTSPLMLTLDVFRDADGRDIRYTITNGTVTITGARQPPQAKFTFSPELPKVNETVQFTDQSTDPDGQVVRWEWDFGDGSTSTEQNPSHKYTAKGKYTVKLTVTDDDGLTNSVTKTVPVGLKPPTAKFTFTPALPRVNQEVKFTDQSVDPDGQITRWAWDFGDGSTSTERNPKHKYAREGTYTVKLTVTDNDGLTSTATKEITVGKGKPKIPVHCYPNPASTQTTFKYTLPEGTATATLYVFDATGRLVFHHAITGTEYTWDLKSDAGEDLPNGPYFYYIVAKDANGKVISRSKINKLVIQRG